MLWRRRKLQRRAWLKRLGQFMNRNVNHVLLVYLQVSARTFPFCGVIISFD